MLFSSFAYVCVVVGGVVLCRYVCVTCCSFYTCAGLLRDVHNERSSTRGPLPADGHTGQAARAHAPLRDLATPRSITLLA